MEGFLVGFFDIFSLLHVPTNTQCRYARNATKPQFLLGFKHFEEKAHKAENNQNKQKIDDKMQVLRDIDFEGILNRFRKGFGRPKFLIFALLSMFFRSRFRSTLKKGKKSTQEAQQDAEGGFLDLVSGCPHPPGERKGEGITSLGLHQKLDLSDSPSVIDFGI